MTISISNWGSHIINNLAALVSVIVFAGFLGFKPRYKKLGVLIAIGFTVISTVLNVLLYTFIGNTRFPVPIYFVLYFGFQLAATILFFEGKLILKILVFFLNKIIDVVSISLLNYVLELSGGLPQHSGADSYWFPLPYYVGCLIVSAIFNVALLLILKLLREKNPKISQTAFLLVPLSQLLLYFAYYYMAVRFDVARVYAFNSLVLAGMIVSVIADVLMFFLIRGIRDKAFMAAQIEVMNAQQEEVLAQTRNLDAVNKKLRAFNHDIVNQLSTVNLLLREGKKDEAEGIIKEISTSLSEYNKKELCAHPVINAVLIMKSALAEQNGVELNLNIDLREEITVRSIDVCSLFANILDNAIEAVIALEPEKRKITMQAFTQGGTLNIISRNPARSDIKIQNNRIKTSKNTELHGLGLMIIENIATNNGGGMRITADDEVFTLTLWMNC